MKRIKELDGLRGIVTIVVFLSHFIGMYPNDLVICNIDISRTCIHMIWDGHASVMIFFLMSGYFSAKKYFKDYSKSIDYKEFVFGRIIRIYPIYILSIFVAYCLFLSPLNVNNHNYSEWFNKFWSSDITIKDILNHIILITEFNVDLINPPIWTLKYEIRVAFVMPIIIWCAKKYNSGIVFFVSLIISKIVFPINSLYVFVLGILIAKEEENIAERFYSLCVKHRKSMVLLALILYGFKFNFYNIASNIKPGQQDLIISIGATILFIVVLVNVKLEEKRLRVLNNKFLIFIGEISYCIYLSHFVILLAFRNLIYFVGNFLILGIVLFIITILISYVMHNFIEVPIIKSYSKFRIKCNKKSEMV